MCQLIGFDRYGHTDTDTDTDIVIPIYSKPIPIQASRIDIKPIPIHASRIDIKLIPISGLGFKSNRYQYR